MTINDSWSKDSVTTVCRTFPAVTKEDMISIVLSYQQGSGIEICTVQYSYNLRSLVPMGTFIYKYDVEHTWCFQIYRKSLLFASFSLQYG